MAKKERRKLKSDDEIEEIPLKSVILLSSSDDEEANRDLTLEIAKKAMLGASKRARRCVVSPDVIDLSSIDDGADSDRSANPVGNIVTPAISDLNTKKKTKEKKKKSKKVDSEEQTFDVAKEDEIVQTPITAQLPKLVDPDAVEIADNTVLRKLLRGPRYFDLPDSSGWGACYNCGEEGHTSVNCTAAKRKKPCFVCGSFEHNVKQCTKAQDCYICKSGGHRAKDCPEKNKVHRSKMCLRCGNSGHDMSSCRNNYASDDLKEIQCYICKSFGHLCCVNYIDNGPREVSCYKCGQSGHTGWSCKSSQGEKTAAGSTGSCFKCGEEGHFARECTRSRGEMNGESSTGGSCYKCGEAGHFARECTGSWVEMTGPGSSGSCYKCGKGGHFARECPSSGKVGKRNHELSTPTRRFYEEDNDYLGFKSEPRDLRKAYRRKNTQYEEINIATPPKKNRRGGWITDDPGDLPRAKRRGGWITDDPGDFPRGNGEMKTWESPATPPSKSRRIYTSTAGGHISSSRVSKNPQKTHSGREANKSYQHRFSASRFGSSSSHRMRNNYDW